MGLGIAVWLVRCSVEQLAGPLLRAYTAATPAPAGLASEGLLIPSMIGGLLGGLSHSLIDALMHADMSPFEPFLAENPLVGLVSAGSVMKFCILAGVLGVVAWGLRREAWRRPEKP